MSAKPPETPIVTREQLLAYAGHHLTGSCNEPPTSATVSIQWGEIEPSEQARIIAELRSALQLWNADDRAEWVAAGQALVGLGEAGYRLWAEWSATSARFPGGDDLGKWGTFKGERSSYRAVFERAQQRGWVNPRSVAAIDTAALGFGDGGAAIPSVPRPRFAYGDARDGTTTTDPLTGHGNALRLQRMTAGKLRHVFEKKYWLKWLACGWRRSDAAEVRDLAIRVLSPAIYKEGAALPAHEFKHFAQHARKSADAGHASATVDILGGMPEVRIAAATLDSDPMLCGFDECRKVIDLRTGIARPAAPTDFITRSLNVPTIGDVAAAIRWCQFVNEIFCYDKELIDWVWRFAGYSLTGSTAEQFFVFLYGHGANGKSVFTEVLRDLLGDYAVSVSPATLCDDRRSGAAASPDLARLDGVRVAIAPEAEASSSLAESLVKGLISGDVMAVRVPYGMPFDMRPTLKLMMTGNYKPHITGTDRGIWRRVRLVPFLASFEGRADTGLQAKLQAEAPHIFAWLVAGCIEWQRRGLKDTPRAIAEATEDYRAENDLLGQWLAERAEQAPAGEEAASVLYSDFSLWAAGNGIQRPWTAPAFGRRLTSYRVNGWNVADRKGTGGMRMRTGIRLKSRFLPSP